MFPIRNKWRIPTSSKVPQNANIAGAGNGPGIGIGEENSCK